MAHMGANEGDWAGITVGTDIGEAFGDGDSTDVVEIVLELWNTIP